MKSIVADPTVVCVSCGEKQRKEKEKEKEKQQQQQGEREEGRESSTEGAADGEALEVEAVVGVAAPERHVHLRR